MTRTLPRGHGRYLGGTPICWSLPWSLLDDNVGVSSMEW